MSDKQLKIDMTAGAPINHSVLGGETREFILAGKDIKRGKITCILKLSDFILPDRSNCIRTIKKLNQYFCQRYGYSHIRELVYGKKSTIPGMQMIINTPVLNMWKQCRQKIREGNTLIMGFTNDESLNPVERFVSKFGFSVVLQNQSNISVIQEQPDDVVRDMNLTLRPVETATQNV